MLLLKKDIIRKKQIDKNIKKFNLSDKKKSIIKIV